MARIPDKQARLTLSEFGEIVDYATSQVDGTGDKRAYLTFRQRKALEYAQKMSSFEEQLAGTALTLPTLEGQPEVPTEDDYKVLNPYTEPQVSASVDAILKPLHPAIDAAQRRIAYEIARAYDYQYQMSLRKEEFDDLEDTIVVEERKAKESEGFEDS